MPTKSTCVLLACFVALASVAFGQSKMVHASGGGLTGATGSFVHCTIGQPLAGRVFVDQQRHTVGFWTDVDSVNAPPPDTTAHAVIVIDSLHASLGTVFGLPVRLLEVTSLTADTVDITFRLEGTCLEVRGIEGITFTGDSAEFVLTFLRSAMVGNTLGEIDLRARLGSVVGTDVRVVAAAWRNAPKATTETRNGHVAIDGICVEGGRVRLVQNVAGVFIRSVSPNPTSSSVRVSTSGSAQEVVRVVVIDLMGRWVHQSVLQMDEHGTAEVEIDASALSVGPYTLHVIGHDTQASANIMVQR